MLENSNEVDEEKVTKKNNISLSRDPTASFPSGIVETSDKHDIFLMIEAEDPPPPQKKPHWKCERWYFVFIELWEKI